MNNVSITTKIGEREIEINKKTMLDYLINSTNILDDAEKALNPIYEKISDDKYYELTELITDCICKYTDMITNKLAECKFIKLIFD